MKVPLPAKLFFLLLAPTFTSAKDEQRQQDRDLRGSYFFRSNSYYNAPTCDSTVSPCQDEICDIVSYQCAVVGPAGPPGPAGKVGPVGAAGRNGKDGQDGAPGPRGLPGAPGARGLPGATGPKGEPGAPGRRGPQGAPGKDGAVGPRGLTGPAGKDGARGAVGPQGQRGATGAQGPRGPPGPAAAPLRVTHACATEMSSPVTLGVCEGGGLSGEAVASCPHGYELTGCSGISQDSPATVLATSCYVQGNQCICSGCDLFGGYGYKYSSLVAHARCCRVASS